MVTRPAWFVMPVLTLAICLTAAYSVGQTQPDYRSGSVPNDDPQPVYSPDPADSWNRIFNTLFTRTVRLRLSEEFAGAAPLERVRVMGFPDLPVSTTAFERIESGDRAIEPLDPLPLHSGSHRTPQRVLSEPHFTRLKLALAEALREEAIRPPLSRALMQSDLWAAHDILVATRPPDEVQRGRKEELLGLLAHSIKKLSLSTREIEGLPDNYALAHLLFNLFEADGGWIEIEYMPTRFHDSSADFRRATRIFLKPSALPRDRDEWLNGFRKEGAHAIEKLDAVALVVQLLLIDTDSVAVPTRLTYEIQVRAFPKGDDGKLLGTKLDVAELSREALLVGHEAGGLHRVEERDPAYLPRAGNDYFFASALLGKPKPDEAILTPLRRRCQSCHGEDIGTIFTFSFHDPKPPPVRELKVADNEHAHFVARSKMQRADFEELKRRWDR